MNLNGGSSRVRAEESERLQTSTPPQMARVGSSVVGGSSSVRTKLRQAVRIGKQHQQREHGRLSIDVEEDYNELRQLVDEDDVAAPSPPTYAFSQSPPPPASPTSSGRVVVDPTRHNRPIGYNAKRSTPHVEEKRGTTKHTTTAKRSVVSGSGSTGFRRTHSARATSAAGFGGVRPTQTQQHTRPVATPTALTPVSFGLAPTAAKPKEKPAVSKPERASSRLGSNRVPSPPPKSTPTCTSSDSPAASFSDTPDAKEPKQRVEVHKEGASRPFDCNPDSSVTTEQEPEMSSIDQSDVPDTSEMVVNEEIANKMDGQPTIMAHETADLVGENTHSQIPQPSDEIAEECRQLPLHDVFTYDAELRLWVVEPRIKQKVVDFVHTMGYPAFVEGASAHRMKLQQIEQQRRLRKQLKLQQGGVPDSPDEVEVTPSSPTMKREQTIQHIAQQYLAIPAEEALRWVSEQEYFVGTVLLCCAYIIQRTVVSGQTAPGTPASSSIVSSPISLTPSASPTSKASPTHTNVEFLKRMKTLVHGNDPGQEVTTEVRRQAIPSNIHPLHYVAQYVVHSYPQWGADLKSNSFAELWKAQVGVVVGVANPACQFPVVSRPGGGNTKGGPASPVASPLEGATNSALRNYYHPSSSGGGGSGSGSGSGITGGVQEGEGITFMSDMESGNLSAVQEAVIGSSRVYMLWIHGDADTEKRSWFRFSFRNAKNCGGGSSGSVEAGRPICLRVMNLTAHAKLYQRHGMRPVWRAGASQPLWKQVDDISYTVVSTTTSGSPSTTKDAHVLNASTHLFDISSSATNSYFSSIAGGGVSPASSCSSGTAVERGVLSFYIIPTSSMETIHVAFCVPYTYGDLLSNIVLWHSMVKKSTCSIRFEERVLCRSLDGRKVHLLIVTSQSELVPSVSNGKRKKKVVSSGRATPLTSVRGSRPKSATTRSSGASSPPPQASSQTSSYSPAALAAIASAKSSLPFCTDFSSGKKVILISGRVHPGEVTASHALHGLVQFLLSNDPRADVLRTHFIFFVVPMLNPDGVARGHTRLDQHGINLNRCYTNPKPAQHPTVHALKNVFQHLHTNFGERLIMYLDFHSHASQSSGFTYGNQHPNPLYQQQNLLYSKLVAAHSKQLFSHELSKFGKGEVSSKEGTSRVLFGRTLIHSYTIELTHFSACSATGALLMPQEGDEKEKESTKEGTSVWCACGAHTQQVNNFVSDVSTSARRIPTTATGCCGSCGGKLKSEDKTTTQPQKHHDNSSASVLEDSATVGRACLLALIDLCQLGHCVEQCKASEKGN